jgi:putative ABC transport system permease protein
MALPPRWHKVIRDLTGHKLRTALVVLSIAVGIFAVGVVLGGRAVLTREFDTDYQGSNAPSAEFYTMTSFDDALVRSVAARSDVRGVQARRIVPLRYTLRATPSSTTAGWDSMNALALPSFSGFTVEKLTREEASSWPPREGGIVLEKSALQMVPFSIGQTITVETDSGERSQLHVVGFAHDINAVPSKFSNVVIGYVSMATLDKLKEPSKYNYLAVSLDPSLSQASASRIAVDIRDRLLAPAGVITRRLNVPKPGSHFLGDIFKALSLLLLALGVLSLALSGFLVVTTVSAIMAQQIRQVGIMKAIGGRARQVMGMYLSLVGIYGVLAVLVGVPLANFAGHWFISYAAGVLNFRVANWNPPAYVLAIEVAVGLLVPILAAIIPVRSGSRRSVVSALNATGMSPNFGHGLVDRILGLIRGLPRPVALSLRNTFKRKGRLALTLTTLILASAVVMAVLSVRASTLKTVDDIASFWNYDVQVYTAQREPGVELKREALKTPGVTDVETRLTTGVAVKREDGSEDQGILGIGIPPDSKFLNPHITAGRWLNDEDKRAIVINPEVVKDLPNVHVGDMVRITVQGREGDWKIVGISGGQMHGAMIFFPKEALDAEIGAHGGVTWLLAKTEAHSPTMQGQVATDLENRLHKAGFAISSSETQSAEKAAIAGQLGILVAFLVIMASLLSIVGIIGLTGTMTINVLESTREIGVMRSLGAAHGSIFGIFITEGVVIAMMAWFVGAVLSWPMSWLLTWGLGQAMSLPLSYTFSWQGVGIWMASVLVIAVVASLIPAWNASRVSVRDAIAYE